MTYRELKDWLDSLNQDQLDKEVAIKDPDREYCLKIEYVQEATDTTSGLKEGHPIINISRWEEHYGNTDIDIPAGSYGEPK